jgi:hypothetical protein
MCPPGVDQSTRVPQIWRIIAPELLQFQEIISDDEVRAWSRPLESKLFNPKIQWDAWGKLTRPSLRPGTINTQLCSSRVRNVSCKLSALEKLSNELMDMILGHLAPEKADIVALGLSSQCLWQVTLHHIHAGYLKCAAPWAGKKIAFQGSYSFDLPESFEEDGMVESITGKSWFGNMCAARRFFWAHTEKDIVTPCSEEAGWLTAALSHRDGSKIPETRWWTIEEELGWSYLSPKNQEWLLRNLTTQEIISSKFLDGKIPRKTRSSKFHAVSFDDVLLMQSIDPTEAPPPLIHDLYLVHCFTIFVPNELTRDFCSMLDEYSELWRQ